MNEEIQKVILNEGNSKIKDSSAYDYLNVLTKTELFQFLSLYRLSMKDVIEAYVLDSKSKKQLVKYITENLDKILKINFNFIKSKDLDALRIILPKIMEKDFDVTYDSIPFSLFLYFKRFFMAKFECEESNIKMFLPKEFCETLIDLLNNNKLCLENKKYNDMFDYIYAITNTYGIIDIDNLHKLFEKDMFEIDKEEFIRIIKSFSLADDYLNIYEYNDSIIVCNIEFMDEEKAVNFYEKQTGKYTVYTKEELALIKNGTFIRKSSHFNEFVDYINSKFELSDKDIDDIVNLLVMDYMYQASTDKEKANESFINNANDMFELSKDEIEEMRNITSQIYSDYPKWIKRGKI